MEISIRIKSLWFHCWGITKAIKKPYHSVSFIVLWSITLAHTLGLTEFVQARATRNTPFSSDYSFLFLLGVGGVGGVGGGSGGGGSSVSSTRFHAICHRTRTKKKG